MTPRRDHFRALCALAVLCLSACGATAEGGDTTSVPPPTVLDVGVLPAPLPSTTSSLPATTIETTVATTTTLFAAPGNRILMIGDSILASTSKRYSNDMCAALVPLGWQVEIEAEVSRAIGFGVDVMRERGDVGWDVGLVFLGTNYGNDDNDYLRQLNRVVGEFGDIPVVLVTVSEYRDEVREVNRVIEAITEVYDNLSIVDWRKITATFPELLNDDGIHPTTRGREVLAGSVALHLGPAPVGPGKCLDSTFTDDSAGTVDGRPSSGSGSGSGSDAGSGSGGGRNTTTTVRQGTTTTTPATSTTTPGGTTTTVPSGGTSPTTTSPGGATPTITTSPGGTPPTTGTTPPPVTTSPAATTPPPVTSAPAPTTLPGP